VEPVTAAGAATMTAMISTLGKRAFTMAALGALLPAQNLTAHPQESLQNTSGNSAPFGVFFGQAAEARTQLLVPKDELPSFPAVLVGIELHGNVDGTVHYNVLQIAAAPSIALQLASSFDTNLPVPPTTVLQATGVPVTYQTSTWTPIVFTMPYLHDGTSGLVLDIRKVVNVPMSSLAMASGAVTTPMRTDRPRMVMASGSSGSGAAYASTATIPPQNAIAFRLRWLGTPTLRNRSDATTSSGNYHGLGGSVLLTVQGTPGDLWVLAAGDTFLPTAVQIPGVFGDLRIANPILFASGLLGAQGQGTATVAIPQNPGLVGLYLSYQAATIDVATVGITLTNGTDHFVNP